MDTTVTSGPGVIPGDGPGKGYVSKGWIIGICSGLFALGLVLLGLLLWKWPADDCASLPMPSGTATSASPNATPPAATSSAGPANAGTISPNGITTSTSVSPSSSSTPATSSPNAVISPSTNTASTEAGTGPSTNTGIANTATVSGPQITRVSPPWGDTSGGLLVHISGTGFTDKTLVRFDGKPAKEVSYLAPTALLAKTPDHSEGIVDVSVQLDSNPGSSLPGAFTYKSCIGQSTVLLLVLFAGALGGTLHSILSLSWYVGNRDFKWSWVPIYAFRPLTGAALACIFFLGINGGLITSANPSNRLWIIGLAALVGLFSAQGFQKLKTIFEAIFTTVPPAADKPLPATTATVLAISPATGPANSVVKITGTGFITGTKVQFGAVVSPSVSVDSPATLTVTVPAATPTDPVDVIVMVPGNPALTLPQKFKYIT